jgi:hypothetical protein
LAFSRNAARHSLDCEQVVFFLFSGVIIGVVLVQVLVVAMGLLLSYCLARRIQEYIS